MYDEDGHWEPDSKPRALALVQTALVVASVVGAVVTLIAKGRLWIVATEVALVVVGIVLVVRRNRKLKKSEENLDLDVLRQIR